jgi:pilus assembly protein CpaB
LKLLKNRSIISVLCLFVAGIVAFVALPRFYQNREAVTTVYRAAAPIPRGTLIEARHIESAEVGAFNLTDRVITEQEFIIGQYALTDIPQHDLILPEKIGEFIFTQTLDTLMKQGRRLVSVTLPSNAAGLSGHLQSGDIVSVVVYIAQHDMFVTDEQTGFDMRLNVPAQTLLLPELQDISVYAIENSKAESMEDLQNSEEMTADTVPKTVTLIVSEEQAVKLVEAENTGKIHLVFERRIG